MNHLGADERGVVVWFTGLPSSGKSTLAEAVRQRLLAADRACVLLDGDDVRAALVPAPGHDEAGRTAFYRTLAQLAALLAQQRLIVLVAATANRRTYREEARRLAPRFVEVFLDVPLATCQARDAKGLYARAAAGELSQLPGAGAAYEPPPAPDMVARGVEDAASIAALLTSGRIHATP
ncbi:MAG TPA: adenylyl-sulfate kinase [Polyangia bacterium]|nr:adenylyl-sulfate kinase [Polyangia bacterium]